MDLVLNSVEWLAGRQDLMAVRPKNADVRQLALTAEQSRWVFRIAVILVPGIALLVSGTAIYYRRSR